MSGATVLIITWSPMAASYCSTMGLFRPQPAEGSGSQQGEDEAVHDVLEGHAPVFAFPDCVLNQRHGVGEERASARDTEDFEVGSAGGAGASGQVRHEDADDDAI